MRGGSARGLSGSTYRVGYGGRRETNNKLGDSGATWAEMP